MIKIPVDLLIIGAGPAGLAAALAAAKAGVTNIILVDRQQELGGILPQCIHQGFGLRYFKAELTGPEYAQRFIDECSKYPQIKIKSGTMAVELNREREVITLSSREGLVCYQARAVVLAMGCRERPRGAINIPGTRPAGVFTAGTVQRMMNIEGYRPGNQAVILGSGDIGLIMARRLTLEGIKVLAVLELLPYSCGLTRNLVQCLHDFQIPLYLHHTITEIYGDLRLTGVKATPVAADRQPIFNRSFRIDCDLLVLSVGLIPENELSLMAGVKLDPVTGGPVVDSNYQTSVPGIFACGNVVHVHDLVDDVSEVGKITGEAAAGFLIGERFAKTVKIKVGRNIRSVVPQRICQNRLSTLLIRPQFPERDVLLRVGNLTVRHRIVNPGETIHFTIKPDECKDVLAELPVSLEKGDI